MENERFNSDPLKQAQEVIFSRKRNKPYHPDIIFNGNPVRKSSNQNLWECFLIVNFILMNILKVRLIKLVNIWSHSQAPKFFPKTISLDL